MTTHTLEVPEKVYYRLHEQATRLQLTLEQVIERMLASDMAQVIAADDEPDALVPRAASDEALAAVCWLSTRFAHVAIPNFERALSDPMTALAIVGIADREP